MVDNPRTPPGAGRRRTAYTSESLLAVAVQVFLDRGYDGSSMEDLSKAAGITKSSIYHHVRSKEELLRLATGRALDALFAVLAEPAAVRGPAEGRLRHVLRRTSEVLLAELPYVTLLLRVRGNTETERWALERRRDFDHHVTSLVEQAAAAGDLRPDLEPALVTRLLFGMINSVAEWYRPQGRTGPEQVTEAVLALAFDGLQRAER